MTKPEAPAKLKIGILTGGGDAPGLNAAISGATQRLRQAGVEVLGIRDGWRGLIENATCEVRADLQSLVPLGGTVIGTSSASPYRNPERDVPRVLENFARLGLGGLIAIGGDGTLSSVRRLVEDHQLPIVAVPKTIDNDVAATDFTFGFFSAVERCAQAMDDLRTTADSHSRVMVVECMGRTAGWITAYAGVAAGAEAILVPERPTELTKLYARLGRLRDQGRRSAIVAVSEGARLYENDVLLSTEETGEFGTYLTGGVAAMVAERIGHNLGWESRAIVLGHLQRAGSPIAFDRIFSLRLGARAARLSLEGRWGQMAALRNGEVVDVPIAEAVGQLKLLPLDFLDRYESFFGDCP